MATKFMNSSRHLVILRLNSGATVHLAPAEVSPSLEDYETANNRSLAKLRSLGEIEALPVEGANAS